MFMTSLYLTQTNARHWACPVYNKPRRLLNPGYQLRCLRRPEKPIPWREHMAAMNQHNQEGQSSRRPPESIPVARPAAGPLRYAGSPDTPGNPDGSSASPWRRRWWAPRPMSRLQALGDLLVVAGVLFVPRIADGILGLTVSDQDSESLPPDRMLIASTLMVGMVAVVAVYLTHRSGQPLSSIGLRRVRFWPTIGTALAATFAMYTTLIVLAVAASLLARPSFETMTEPMRQIRSRLGAPSWGTIFLIAASAGSSRRSSFEGSC